MNIKKAPNEIIITALIGVVGLLISSFLVFSMIKSDNTIEPPQPNNKQDIKKFIVKVGKNDLECISYDNTLSCNWDKFNGKIKACEEDSLKRRTTKEGIIFHAIEGECE